MKIVALVPFDIYPPAFGGGQRCVKLLERIGPVTVIGLDWFGEGREEQYGDVTYKFISAGKPAWERSRKLFGKDLFTYDGMPAFCKSDLTHLQDAIEAEAPDLMILEHPWLYPFVGDVPFIYDAHNAEAFLASLRWPGGLDAQAAKELETAAVKNARAITYCSEQDAEIFRKYYNPTAPLHFIPNGTDLPDTLAEGKEKNFLFVGSYYGPNIQAAQALANLAYLLPDYKINIVGACGNNVKTTQPNVKLWGHVEDDVLDELHRKTYAFINLITTGGGTSLKVARAMSYGIPVISTRVGARGFEGVTVIDNIDELLQVLENLEWGTASIASRTYAERISWDRVGMKFRGIVGGVAGG